MCRTAAAAAAAAGRHAIIGEAIAGADRFGKCIPCRLRELPFGSAVMASDPARAARNHRKVTRFRMGYVTTCRKRSGANAVRNIETPMFAQHFRQKTCCIPVSKRYSQLLLELHFGNCGGFYFEQEQSVKRSRLQIRNLRCVDIHCPVHSCHWTLTTLLPRAGETRIPKR